MKRTVGVLLFVLSGLASAGALPPQDPNEWLPDDSIVLAADTVAMKLQLPSEFGPISNYGRYYWGTVVGGRRVVEGFLLSPQWANTLADADRNSRSVKGASAQIHIVSEKNAPVVFDGGCTVVFIRFDVESGKFDEANCNAELPRPPPPERRSD